MFRTFGKYGAGLIGLYLVVFYATGAGTVVSAGSKGIAEDVMALQGRSK